MFVNNVLTLFAYNITHPFMNVFVSAVNVKFRQ